MKLIWDEDAWDDYFWWQTQDRKILKRINGKPANAAELMAQEEIDGALVGGASLDAKSFAGIVKY